jgi:hypothetical protein
MSQGRLARRISLASLVAAAVLTANASPAGAAVTIGQLAPGSPTAICSGAFDSVQTAVTSGSSYAVPSTVATGTITSWSHNAAAGTGQMLTMKVFRPLGGAAYQVVGHDGPRPVSPSGIPGLNTFPTRIAVRAGDVVGLTTLSGSTNTACGFIVGDGNLHRERAGDLPDGASDNFGPEFGTTRRNVSAVVEPDCDTDGLGDESQDTDTASCRGAAAAALKCKGAQATIVGTSGNDVRSGTPGRDVMVGQGGNDRLSGLAGKDLICGGAGKDKLLGGKGKDTLLGQKGKDKLKGGGGKDICKGGKGNDTASKCEVEKSI